MSVHYGAIIVKSYSHPTGQLLVDFDVVGLPVMTVFSFLLGLLNGEGSKHFQSNQFDSITGAKSRGKSATLGKWRKGIKTRETRC